MCPENAKLPSKILTYLDHTRRRKAKMLSLALSLALALSFALGWLLVVLALSWAPL